MRGGDLTGAQATILMPLEELQRLTDTPGQINQIVIANRGDATTSVMLSGEVSARIRPLLVDPESARRIHGLLSTEIARSELSAALPGLDERSRGQVGALLEELDQAEPSERFAAIVSDPELERRLFALSGRLAAQQGRGGTSALATLSTLRVIEVKRLSQELADRWGAALTTVFVVLGLFSIATGTMLVVLIFVMLAAERRTELGVLRALGRHAGTRRGDAALRGAALRPGGGGHWGGGWGGAGSRADLDERRGAERFRDRVDAARRAGQPGHGVLSRRGRHDAEHRRECLAGRPGHDRRGDPRPPEPPRSPNSRQPLVDRVAAARGWSARRRS